jgi:hypothetical protein
LTQRAAARSGDADGAKREPLDLFGEDAPQRGHDVRAKGGKSRKLERHRKDPQSNRNARDHAVD